MFKFDVPERKVWIVYPSYSVIVPPVALAEPGYLIMTIPEPPSPPV
jgi:hypothetical protein